MTELLDPKWLDVSLKAIEMLAIVIIAVITWINAKGKAATSEVKRVDTERQTDRKELEARIKQDRADLEKRIHSDKRELIQRIDNVNTNLSSKVDTVELDVRELRTQLNNLPDDDDIKEIHGRITDLGKTLGTQFGEMKGTLDGVNKAVDRIQDFLLNQGGKP